MVANWRWGERIWSLENRMSLHLDGLAGDGTHGGWGKGERVVGNMDGWISISYDFDDILVWDGMELGFSFSPSPPPFFFSSREWEGKFLHWKRAGGRVFFMVDP